MSENAGELKVAPSVIIGERNMNNHRNWVQYQHYCMSHKAAARRKRLAAKAAR